MCHSSICCMRHSWGREFPSLNLNQLVLLSIGPDTYIDLYSTTYSYMLRVFVCNWHVPGVMSTDCCCRCCCSLCDYAAVAAAAADASSSFLLLSVFARRITKYVAVVHSIWFQWFRPLRSNTIYFSCTPWQYCRIFCLELPMKTAWAITGVRASKAGFSPPIRSPPCVSDKIYLFGKH